MPTWPKKKTDAEQSNNPHLTGGEKHTACPIKHLRHLRALDLHLLGDREDLQFAAAQLALRHGDRRVAGSVLRRLEKSRWMPEVVQAAVSGPIWVKEGSMAGTFSEGTWRPIDYSPGPSEGDLFIGQ